MLNIRPVSDLRNRFSEVEEDVLSKGEPVFLTKNGYGSMVLLSLEQYEELTNDVELALDEGAQPPSIWSNGARFPLAGA